MNAPARTPGNGSRAAETTAAVPEAGADQAEAARAVPEAEADGITGGMIRTAATAGMTTSRAAVNRSGRTMSPPLLFYASTIKPQKALIVEA